jgi:hypothetical protein
MRTHIEQEADRVEVAGYDAILEILKTQHETHRAMLEVFSTLALNLLEGVREHSKKSDENEARRIDIEADRLQFQKEKLAYERSCQHASCERESAEDSSGLSTKALATKSRTRAKPKAKSRSTKG